MECGASSSLRSTATACSRGPDLDGVRQIAEALRGTFIYSGGVASLEDLERLVSLRQVNLTGVIVGKALYEGRFTVAAGQAMLTEGAPPSETHQ